MADLYIREHWGFIDAVCKLNSIPFDGTGERIERDGMWRVYEFAVQLDAIQFWERFEGRRIRGEEFIYPDSPKGLPQLREPVDTGRFEGGGKGYNQSRGREWCETVRVPISIRRRAGRKLVLAPGVTEVTAAPIKRYVDNAMVKAIARAFRWRGMLESGTHATIIELAATEKINESYVGRVLRLTLLAPDIIQAILGGQAAGGVAA